MFHTWLKNNKIESYDFVTPLLPTGKDREFWKEKGKEFYVTAAEKYLDFSWPIVKATDFMAFNKEGNRVKQENPSLKRRAVLCTLFLAELTEYKGRFLPDIVNGIFAICEETFWGLSAHMNPVSYPDGQHALVGMPPNIPSVQKENIDLFAAETGAALAMIYHVLEEELYTFCPEILQRIEYELNRRIIEPYLDHCDFFWMGYFRKVNNWNPWILSNIATVFLLAEKKRTVLLEGIRKMIYEIQGIYDQYPEDGGCDEGAGYWVVSGGRLFDFCNQLYVATDGKINFFEDKKMKRIARYLYLVSIGNDYVANFADCSPKIDNAAGSILHSFGERVGDKNASQMGRSMWKRSLEKAEQKFCMTGAEQLKCQLYGMIWLNDAGQNEIDESDMIENGSQILENTQQIFVREDQWYYAAKGGTNAENHNHNDVGSFLVYYDNMPVLIDPSCGTYTAKTFSEERYTIWTMQSSWHNLPEVNGYMQKDGEEYAAEIFKEDGEKAVISFAGAYPKEAEIVQLKRSLKLKEYMEVTDWFAFAKENNFVCENFVTPLSVQVQGASILIGEKYELIVQAKAEGKKQKVEICTDKVDFLGDKKLEESWDNTFLNRIRIHVQIKQEGTISVVLRRK